MRGGGEAMDLNERIGSSCSKTRCQSLWAAPPVFSFILINRNLILFGMAVCIS